MTRQMTRADGFAAAVVATLLLMRLTGPAPAPAAALPESTPTLIGFGAGDVEALVREQLGLPAETPKKPLPLEGTATMHAAVSATVYVLRTADGDYEVALAGVLPRSSGPAGIARIRTIVFNRTVQFRQTGRADPSGRPEVTMSIDAFGESDLAARLIGEELVDPAGQ